MQQNFDVIIHSLSTEALYLCAYSKFVLLVNNTEILGSDEETLLSGPFGFVQGHSQRAEDSHSEYISCFSSLDKLVHDDMKFWKTEEDAPLPESHVVVPSWSQTAGEKSSTSEYFSCVSARKLIFADEDGIHQLFQVVSCFESPEIPLSQDLEQWETSSPFPQVSFPFHLVNSNESFVSSVHMQEKRFMKIYYMHVQLERGVAILWNTGEGLKPPSKKIRIEEMTCPEKVPTAFTFCRVSTKELLTDTEFISDSKAQEEREKESPAEPPALEECSRAKTPEWLVALDSGFRCMGCCRVFPSLEVLQEHVERGIN
ncbi:Protein FAM170A [Camelus dromedarius]|uniref:Protein FAM170A n=1 Tax=Camelus dromedarius TaxID=9838 RepID=A0A5N4EDM0_CAMDR|nr:Protein FAM170A [Camelus dromedarius]